MPPVEEEKKSSKYKSIAQIKVPPSFIQHVGIFIPTLPQNVILNQQNMPLGNDLKLEDLMSEYEQQLI